jgi:hypothetical protein
MSRRGTGRSTPRHCPRCIARAHRIVTLLALDEVPPRAATTSRREA